METIECKFEKDTINLIKRMLLCNKVRLSEIPFCIRSLDISLYGIACILSRKISKAQHTQDIGIILRDSKLVDPSKREQLLQIRRRESKKIT